MTVASPSIDRRTLVRRHNPTVHRADPFSALTVGNGQFAFTADVTGLQTFWDEYRADFPLCTASHWAWHTTPIPPGLDPEQFRYEPYNTYGRPVGYATSSRGQEALFGWLRKNPHRLHLGRIALELIKPDGSPATSSDLRDIQQTLDLYSGLLDSRFTFADAPVHVQTCCHPDLDLLAVRIESPLLSSGALRVLIAFGYGSPEMDMVDWTVPQRHYTHCTLNGSRADLARKLDNDSYFVTLEFSNANFEDAGGHRYRLRSAGDRPVEFVVHFSPDRQAEALPDFARTADASANHWEEFWTTGGAIDLTASTAPQAPELQRRIILCQFLTALHCAGSLPPAETGLLFNSWYGKFHLEMHWWHAAHFHYWNRFELLEKSLDFYHRIFGVAHEIAHRQGYDGARWPKMVGPDGNDSPSPIGPLLIWQQPHLIHYAELCYRRRPTEQTLAKWQEIVFDTAEFMSQYAVLDQRTGRYVLGPPLKTVSENTDARRTKNPTFELAYWRSGLRIAQVWRQRLRQPPHPHWQDVLDRLSDLPAQDGVYLLQEGLTDTYEKWNVDHPAMLGAMGMQSGDGVDEPTMARTLARVMQTWKWETAWGWDFPMAAMTATRVGQPQLAIDALTMDSPKNHYHPNGHVYQRPGLTAYLPANGGLLAAASLMAAGWHGCPVTTPGFPPDGKWSVRSERLQPWS